MVNHLELETKWLWQNNFPLLNVLTGTETRWRSEKFLAFPGKILDINQLSPCVPGFYSSAVRTLYLIKESTRKAARVD